jgi:hypothetical protein
MSGVAHQHVSEGVKLQPQAPKSHDFGYWTTPQAAMHQQVAGLARPG